MKGPEIRIFKKSDGISDYIHKLLSRIDSINYFHIALSGGNTPKLIYSYLAKTSHPAIPWNKIRFYWGDERCVPPDHPESNYLMTKKVMLDNIEVSESQIFRIKGENDPFIEKIRYEQLLLSNNNGIFDLVLLGLGEDGHTASIFPDQKELLISEDLCEIARHPITGQNRITLTGNAINNAKIIAFIVTGINKSTVVKDVLNKTGNWDKYPASYISSNSGKLLWLLDEEAAAELKTIKPAN